MSEPMWHYVKGGIWLGPFSLSQMQQLVRAGALLPTNTVWEGEGTDPVPASAVTALFPAVGPPGPGRAATAEGAAAAGRDAAGVPLLKWALSFAALGACGAVGSLFSPDLRDASVTGAAAAGLVCFSTQLFERGRPLAAVGLGLLAAVTGGIGGAITHSVGWFVPGLALSAAAGGGVGVAIAKGVTAVGDGPVT
jgi:GYF domain 2